MRAKLVVEMFISKLRTLHEISYFPSTGISRKAQKDKVNIIFPSTVWLKKDYISHHRKVQNKNFSVISKYHLSSAFWLKKRPYFLSQNSSNEKIFSDQ